jgi:hypothetical protein
VQEQKIIKEIDDKVNFQEVHSQVNEQLKSVLHPPKPADFIVTLDQLPFEELAEMTKSDDYLKEVILCSEPMTAFSLECASISDKAIDTAKLNTKLIENVSQEMER